MAVTQMEDGCKRHMYALPIIEWPMGWRRKQAALRRIRTPHCYLPFDAGEKFSSTTNKPLLDTSDANMREMTKAVPFTPSLDAARLDDLRERLARACREAEERPGPSAPFEMSKPQFGMTYERHRELLFAWRDFLSTSHASTSSASESEAARTNGSKSKNSTKKKNRPGADHDTWQAFEKNMHQFDHFLMDIEDISMHFVHEKASQLQNGEQRQVIPLLLLHGWPSSVHDFFNVIKPLAHPGPGAPSNVPAFDVVVPSQTGYLWSSSPTVDAFGFGRHSGSQGDFTVRDEARIVHKLMMGLGYKRYAIQAGDWGTVLSRRMAQLYPKHVVALHLNFCPAPPPPLDPPILRLVPQPVKNVAWALTPTPLAKVVEDIWMLPRWREPIYYANETTFAYALGHAIFGLPAPLSPADRRKVKRSTLFQSNGSAYAKMQGSRPSTLGLVLQSDPAALLAWIGEKMHQWTDEDPADSDLCGLLTLWWCTDTMARSIYQYRDRGAPVARSEMGTNWTYYVNTPTGMSDFPKEIIPAPLAWQRKIVNIQWHRSHDEGGHFVSLEKPVIYIQDVRDCFAYLWPKAAGSK